MIWRIPGISLNLHYPKEDDGELYTACPIIKGSRGIEPLNPLPQRRIRLTLPAYLCLKTALRRSEIREYYMELFLLPLGDEIVEPRIGASGVIWRVRQIDDVFVRANRKALDTAKFGELCAKLLTEIGSAFFIVGERHAKDCDGAGFLLGNGIHLVKAHVESRFVGIMFCFLSHSIL